MARRCRLSLFMLLHLAALSEGLGTGVYGVPGEQVGALKDLLGMSARA